MKIVQTLFGDMATFESREMPYAEYQEVCRRKEIQQAQRFFLSKFGRDPLDVPEGRHAVPIKEDKEYVFMEAHVSYGAVSVVQVRYWDEQLTMNCFDFNNDGTLTEYGIKYTDIEEIEQCIEECKNNNLRKSLEKSLSLRLQYINRNYKLPKQQLLWLRNEFPVTEKEMPVSSSWYKCESMICNLAGMGEIQLDDYNDGNDGNNEFVSNCVSSLVYRNKSNVLVCNQLMEIEFKNMGTLLHEIKTKAVALEFYELAQNISIIQKYIEMAYAEVAMYMKK